MRAVLLGIAAACASACGSSSAPLAAAGSSGDEGHGLLGQQSIQLMTGSASDEDVRTGADREEPEGYGDPSDEPDDEIDASQAFGGDAYGGRTYASFVVRPWPVSTPNREPPYEQKPNLQGAIEGTVAWRGSVPARLTTACGAIDPLKLTAERRVPGVIVFIETVRVGRAMDTYDAKPLLVGGTVLKRGCALVPAAQVAAPVPIAVDVHTDTKPAQLRVTRSAAGDAKPVDLALQPASHRAISLERGTARIESQDGSLAAAHILGLATPYYAVTDDRGHFRIDELAPGTYDVSIWQAPVPTLVAGKLLYGAPQLSKRKVTVPPGPKAARLDITLGR